MFLDQVELLLVGWNKIHVLKLLRTQTSTTFFIPLLLHESENHPKIDFIFLICYFTFYVLPWYWTPNISPETKQNTKYKKNVIRNANIKWTVIKTIQRELHLNQGALAWKKYTTAGCGGSDKYQLWRSLFEIALINKVQQCVNQASELCPWPIFTKKHFHLSFSLFLLLQMLSTCWYWSDRR